MVAGEEEGIGEGVEELYRSLGLRRGNRGCIKVKRKKEVGEEAERVVFGLLWENVQC